MKQLAAAWDQFWFRPAAPHLYAVLRILWGLLALVNLFSVADLKAYWYLSGLVGPRDTAFQVFVTRFAPDTTVAVWLFAASLVIYVLMTVGFWCALTVPLSFVALLVEKQWNQLPLSAAFQVHYTLMFCLALAETGEVWSVDAWLRRRRGDTSVRTVRIWPLRLFRAQVAIIYFFTGFWKFQDVHWRDGSAMHYVMNNLIFRRFPIDPPAWIDPVLTLVTYMTLAWELAFPFMLFNRHTRRAILLLGLAMHIGMWSVMEIGPFSWVMIASYVAFVDPDWFAGWVARRTERRRERTEVAAIS
jgi:vitamin K-dependent gamma-carboxylase-like protein